MNKHEMKRNYRMLTIARLYIERPDDKYFKKMAEEKPGMFKSVKLLAEAIQKKIDLGEMT